MVPCTGATYTTVTARAIIAVIMIIAYVRLIATIIARNNSHIIAAIEAAIIAVIIPAI